MKKLLAVPTFLALAIAFMVANVADVYATRPAQTQEAQGNLFVTDAVGNSVYEDSASPLTKAAQASATSVEAIRAAVLSSNGSASHYVAETTAAVAALRANAPSSTQAADMLTAARASGTELIAQTALLAALPRGGVTHWSTPFTASTTAGAFVVPCPANSNIVALGVSIIGSSTQYVYVGINQAGESGMNRIAAINAPIAAGNLLMGYSCTITVDSQVDQGGVLGSVWAIWR